MPTKGPHLLGLKEQAFHYIPGMSGQECRSLLSIGGGIICNLTPILPYFRHWGGGINLDHDFVQVSK